MKLPNCDDSIVNTELTHILPLDSSNISNDMISERREQLHAPISEDVIVSKLSKKNQLKGKKLLEALKDSGRFEIDHLGIVKIDGVGIHSSVFDLLQISFCSKRKKVSGLDIYIKLLKSLNLFSFITNHNIIEDDEDIEKNEFWYYIGN